jgi:hypothetical protein
VASGGAQHPMLGGRAIEYFANVEPKFPFVRHLRCVSFRGVAGVAFHSIVLTPFAPRVPAHAHTPRPPICDVVTSPYPLPAGLVCRLSK